MLNLKRILLTTAIGLSCVFGAASSSATPQTGEELATLYKSTENYSEICIPRTPSGSHFAIISGDNETGHYPESGWKLHVAANADNTQDIFKLVAPYLAQNNILAKAICCDRIYGPYTEERAGTQRGKFITIYPNQNEHGDNFSEMIRIAKDLDSIIKDANLPPCTAFPPSDAQLGTSGYLYLRYGSFIGYTMQTMHTNGKLSTTADPVKDIRDIPCSEFVWTYLQQKKSEFAGLSLTWTVPGTHKTLNLLDEDKSSWLDFINPGSFHGAITDPSKFLITYEQICTSVVEQKNVSTDLPSAESSVRRHKQQMGQVLPELGLEIPGVFFFQVPSFSSPATTPQPTRTEPDRGILGWFGDLYTALTKNSSLYDPNSDEFN